MLTPLSEILRLPFKTQLSLLVLPISEAYPPNNAGRECHQELRVKLPGGAMIPLHLYGQRQVMQTDEGKTFRAYGDPDYPLAIECALSKAAKPSAQLRILVVRKGAHSDVFAGQSEGFGFRVREPTVQPVPRARPAPQVLPDMVQPVAPDPGSLVPLASHAVAPIVKPSAADLVAESRRFAECLQAARQALGPGASADDIRETARLTFERCYAVAG